MQSPLEGREMADASELGIGLAEAIAMLRGEVLRARAAGAGSAVQFLWPR